MFDTDIPFAPFIGFYTPDASSTTNAALFSVRPSNDGGGYDDWTFDVPASTRHIPGSNRSVRQSMGIGAAEITLQVTVYGIDQWQRLLAKLDTTGTLRLIAHMQSLRGTVRKIQPHMYEDLTGCVLINISTPVWYPDQEIEAAITFQRPVNPLTGGAS